MKFKRVTSVFLARGFVLLQYLLLLLKSTAHKELQCLSKILPQILRQQSFLKFWSIILGILLAPIPLIRTKREKHHKYCVPVQPPVISF
ncbi:MAG: hypothetical protein D3916_07090 [Candidatus Electrothrix sp. MAN1_4]|nr:hypothetical protein [Candidatus Electrothrix sp. MAN1_4]